MATKIVTKNRLADATIPSNSDLLKGELAVNLASFKLYSSTNGTDVIEICPVGALLSGAGITAGSVGEMSSDITVAVGAGAGITVNTNDVATDEAYAHTWSSVQTFGAGVVEKTTTLGTSGGDVDCDLGNNFTVTLAGDSTFVFTNPPSAGEAYGCTVVVTQHASIERLCSFTSVLWPYGITPDVPAIGDTAVYTFFYDTAASAWYGFKAGDEMAA